MESWWDLDVVDDACRNSTVGPAGGTRTQPPAPPVAFVADPDRSSCLNHCSDAELCQAWAAGDRRAGDLLARTYMQSLRQYFRRKGAEDVEDLVQRTLLGAMRSLPNFRHDASFRTFLFTIARNTFVDELRRTRRARQRVEDFVEEELPDPGTKARLTGVLAKTRLTDVACAMSRLSEQDRSLLHSYVDDEMSGPCLAAELGITLPALRSRLRRARARLRAELDSHRHRGVMVG